MYERASHTVKPGALQHPLQKACEELMRNSPELYKIWQEVHAHARVIGKKTPALVNAGVVDWAKGNGHYDRVKSMVNSFLDKEKVARDGVKHLSLAPPKSSELYERVDPKADIVDVGVGDGKRLVRYAGYFGNVRGVDIVRRSMVPGWPSNWTVEVKFCATESRICTSFLVYSQLDTRTLGEIENTDGLHVVPYHPELRRLGVVKDLDDGRVECEMGDKKFVERDLGDVRGEMLRSYYCGINTYRERELSLQPSGRKQFKPVGNRYFVRMQRDLFVDEFTPKYDGVFMELRVSSGNFVLKDALGRGVWGKCSDAPNMVLHLELLKDCWILLRVEKYRDYRPYHSLGMLEKFCSRVKVKIKDKIVQAPVRIKNLAKWQEEYPQADGVVCREGGMDYVMNCGTHLDLTADFEKELTEFLRAKMGCKTVLHKGDRPLGKIYQVCCKLEDDGRAVCEWRARNDKVNVDQQRFWQKKFKLLSIERYLLKFEGDKDEDGMVWEEEDGTDD